MLTLAPSFINKTIRCNQVFMWFGSSSQYKFDSSSTNSIQIDNWHLCEPRMLPRFELEMSTKLPLQSAMKKEISVSFIFFVSLDIGSPDCKCSYCRIYTIGCQESHHSPCCEPFNHQSDYESCKLTWIMLPGVSLNGRWWQAQAEPLVSTRTSLHAPIKVITISVSLS